MMRTFYKALLTGGTLALACASAPVNALTLLNLTNPAAQTNTPYSLSFTATSATTTLSVAGYQVPSNERVRQSAVRLGAGANLLGQTWVFTPAPAGSFAFQESDGANVNILTFAGTTEGSYDTFTQSFATSIGSTYTYSFLFTNNTLNSPSGLRVDVNAPAANAVPEPTTWAMMMIGFGVMGYAMRRRRHVGARIRFA